ncbi:MAG: putative sulfate/molybdate transporter [Terriglobia bacterium]
MGTATVTEVKVARWPITRLDIAGAFGDIGVLFPIAIALISLNRLNPTAVFLAAGLAYILSGAYFKVPVPVQPLKAVAAIALALHLPASTIASAGLLMGVVLLLIGITNLAPLLARLFTLPIVRGIQLGLGLLLVREGLRLILQRREGLALGGFVAVSSLLIALGATALLLALRRSQRFPAALVLLFAGVVLGILSHWSALPSFAPGPLPLELIRPDSSELKRALVTLVLPQFALTFGNSIVASENTAQLLFGPQAHRVSTRALSLSIGVMNLASGAILAAPMCHGSGGITAHYKFGARSQKSNYIIGGVCLLLALLGASAVGLLKLIPVTILGVFLLYVGIQHAAFLRDIVRNRAYLFIAVAVGLVALATTNLTWGFLVGFALQAMFLAYSRFRRT